MSDNKKYYYLKFKENFFDSEAMIILESMPDGYLYSNILIKLYLRSLKNEGKLMFNNTIPYNSTILSQVVRHNVGVVEKALAVFKHLGLIEMLDNGAIYMLEIQNYIGQSSNEADRQRDYQNRIKKDALGLVYKPRKKSNRETNGIPTPEKELNKSKTIIKDINIVIDYYCQKTYRPKTTDKVIIKNITEVLKSYSIDDCKKVIDFIIVDKWYKDNGYDTLSSIFKPTKFHEKFERALVYKIIRPEGVFKQEDYTNDKIIKVIGFAPNQDTNKF